MDNTFLGLIGQSVIVYLDDVTMFSKKISDHVCPLKHIFEWRRKYGIYLNPKKSIVDVSKGILFDHIIDKSGIKIDLEMVKEITQILFLVNRNSM